MNKRKKNIVLGLLVLDILLCAIFTSAFNFLMNEYIDITARKSIELEAELHTQQIDGDEDKYDDIVFSSVLLYRDESDIDFRNLHDSEKNEIFLLLEAWINNSGELSKDKVVTVDIKGKKHYIKRIFINEYGLTDEVLLYINVDPFKKMVSKINMVFLMLFVISAIIICYAGFRAGKLLDDSENKMKRFFENVSHEMKTPIMTIQGYAEGIEQGIMDDTQSAARVIMSESDKMTTMVNEILELSKLESGTIKAEFGLTDIGEIIYECLDRLMPISKRNNISLDIDITEGILALCDDDLIEKLILNILTNAYRYANDRVLVTLYGVGDMAHISICDDGGALSKEDAKYVFERFYRGENGLTGVGLSLAKEIVTLHKGKIGVNIRGNDTCFEVILPIRG